MNLDSYFTHIKITKFTKINSKWITVFKIKADTMKFLEENMGVNLCDPEVDNT